MMPIVDTLKRLDKLINAIIEENRELREENIRLKKAMGYVNIKDIIQHDPGSDRKIVIGE